MNGVAIYTDGFKKDEDIDADELYPNSNIRCTYKLNFIELCNRFAGQVYAYAHSLTALKAVKSGAIKL